MIDTHAHLDFPQFNNDRNRVISECHENGVNFIVNIGVNLESSRESIKLAEKYDYIYAAVGYHPHDSKELTDSAFKEIEKLAKHPKVAAIGEIGLDFYRNLSPPDIQKKAFIRQLDLADRLDLPVVLHIRQALDEAYDILRGRDRNSGILHAFPGDERYAAEGIEMGYYIAFGGPITYPKSKGPRVAKTLPVSRIMTETDCPYLAPQNYRGKRNRPDYVRHVIEKLTEVFPRYSFEDIERITELNASRALELPVADPAKVVYKIGGSLYINLTMRCTNDCYFCPKNKGYHVAGHNLLLQREPEETEILRGIADYDDYQEIVFCGLGEPTLRADLLISLAEKLRQKGVRLRLNTNGQGNIITRSDLTEKLAGLFDVVNVSLNAPDSVVYNKVCSPQFGENIYKDVVSFAQQCNKAGIKTVLSVVKLHEIDIEACKKVAENIGIPLKVREYVSD